MQLDDAATILSRADFFDICDAEQRRLLAFASERKRYRPGTLVQSAGDIPDGAHILVSGTLSTTHEGREENPFLVHRPGSVLGSIALIVSRPRPVTVKAVDSVETLFVPRRAFMKLCNQYPDLAERAAQRIRRDLAGYLSVVGSMKGRIPKD